MSSILNKANKKLTPITAGRLKELDIIFDGGWGSPIDRMKYDTNHYILNPYFEWDGEDHVQEKFDVYYFPKKFQGVVVDIWPVDVRGCLVVQHNNGGEMMGWPVNNIETIQNVLRQLLKFVRDEDTTPFHKLPNKLRPLTREEIDNRKPKKSFYTRFHGNENEIREWFTSQQIKGKHEYIK